MTIFHVIKYGELNPFSISMPGDVQNDIIDWYLTIGYSFGKELYPIALKEKLKQLLLAYEGPL